MKAKVAKRYVDRNTKEIKDVGNIEDYPKARAEELMRGGYIEIIKEDQEDKPQKKV